MNEKPADATPRDIMDTTDAASADDAAGIKAAEDKVRKSLERDTFVPPPGMSSGTPSGIPGFDYSPVNPDEEFKAAAGTPLPEGAEVATAEIIIEALQTVYDPEIPVNIYDLGLIYNLKIDEKGDIKIDMTLTAPGCPVAGEMPGMVARAVELVEGTGEIEVTLVWEPQWTPDQMSEDAKLALGMG
ncbi:MAG: SUF system Fe-S cluster assembly protein [Rhodospirillales bacterium]